jgi:hypothetical protein
MRLLPNLGPLDSSFPLFGTPRLRVVVRGKGVPAARNDAVLTIEVTNLSSRPVGVASVHVGYMYTNAVSEAVFGRRAPELELRELSGRTPLPATLSVGESVTWTASLEQLAADVQERRLTLGPHSPYLDRRRFEAEILSGDRTRRATVAVRNAVSAWSYRRLALVVRDDRGTLYKAKVRWQPPGGGPPHTRIPSLSRA